MPKITLDDLAHNLDDLARIVNKGFDAIDKRFDQNESAHVKIITEIHNEVGSVRGEISLIWQELKEINKKLDRLSDRTFEDSELAFKEIMQMKKRVGFLEEEVKKLKLSQ